jgi:hypothetical protein
MMRNAYAVWSVIPEGTDHSEDLYVNERIILKLVLAISVRKI